MATRKTPSLLPVHLFSLLVCFLPSTIYCGEIERENAHIKGMFVFGSSLVDNGNNNFLQNSAKADYIPYGIDFPLGPSGRFTNGKNIIDLLGDQLKLPSFIPPFYHPSTKGNRIVGGVNYASGGSGILDETGSIAGEVISLNKQIKNFEEVTLPDLKVQLEGNSIESISKYLFVVGSGGNDYTLNYVLTKLGSPITLDAFTNNLTSTLSHQLKKLHSLGARKFIIMAVYPLGCSPGLMAAHLRQKVCVQYLNRAARLFNANLRSLVDDIRPQMPGSSLVAVDTYNIIRDILKYPASYGFQDTNNACCEAPSSKEGGNGISCKKGGVTCANRSLHVYFDGLHPTEAVNVVLATKAYASDSKAEVYPINVRQLAQI